MVFRKNLINAGSRTNPAAYHCVKLKKEIEHYDENYTILSKCSKFSIASGYVMSEVISVHVRILM